MRSLWRSLCCWWQPFWQRAFRHYKRSMLGVLSDLELRSITGHKSEKVFENYIRVSLSEQAQRVGDKIKAAREAMKKQVDK